MDSNAQESLEAGFRKPSNDAAHRKYRRRSPVEGSSSSDGSPHRERSSSPVPSRKDITKTDDVKLKKEDRRSRSGRGGETYKHSDRHSSRNYHKHDDRTRRDRHADDYDYHSRHDKHVSKYDRGYSKSSYRGRDDNNFDRSRGDKEHRSKDYSNDVETHSHAKSEGLDQRRKEKDSYERAGSGRDKDRHREDRDDRYRKADHRKSLGEQKSDRSPPYEESRDQRNDSSSHKDISGHRLKEDSQCNAKELDAERYKNDEKRRTDNRGIPEDQQNREPQEESEGPSIKVQESVAKKPRVSNWDNAGTSEYVTDSDINAAKIAAVKAAELVNKNLVATGYMSTDQKKKLLWGNKKTTAAEESTHRWDTTTFGDRERQEKFNKLMGVKGGVAKVDPKPDNPEVEKQREQLQVELEKQYTAGLRRRDGRTVGLGL